jgi:hypothetical protein
MIPQSFSVQTALVDPSEGFYRGGRRAAFRFDLAAAIHVRIYSGSQAA